MEYLTFREKFLEDLVRFWNKNFPGNELNEEMFRERVLEHPEFEKKNFILSREEKKLTGFSHVCQEGDEGYICFIYVAPEHRERGIGSELLERSREKLDGRLWVGKEFETPFYGNREDPFPPLYGTTQYLGLKSGDKESIKFFQRKGFSIATKTVSMECSLDEHEYEVKDDKKIFSTEKNLEPWTGYENDVFVSWSADWKGETEGVLVWFPLEEERIGIYDLHIKRRGKRKKVAWELMNHALEKMQKKGNYFCEVVLNAFDRDMLFYEKLGFKPDSYWISMVSDSS